MSDTDDGFDKEAEREKLREKYEADEEDRKATQQMSELLLQGATMTNKHCDACGNPRFRYEGQTFCANCDGGNGGASADSEPEAPSGGEAPANQPNQQQGASQPNEQPETNQPTPAGGSATPESNGRPEPSEPTGQRPTPASNPEPGQPTISEEASANTQPESTGTPNADAADLNAARESVRATLTDLAARAERSNDAAHTRELLAATKEAAETLRELNRLE